LKNPTKNYVAIRLSAMGDVALCVPVVQVFCTQNENMHLYFITRKAFQPLFHGIPNLSFITPDLYGKHKGIFGIHRLFKEIKAEFGEVEAYFDLHDVLRSKVLGGFCGLFSRAKTFKINKGRKGKKELTRKENKIFKPLKTSTQRYSDVFSKAGFQLDLAKFKPLELPSTDKINELPLNPTKKKIGIAPFAQHKGKAYPLEKMEVVISNLLEKDWQVFIFGGGKSEAKSAQEIVERNPEVISLIGKFSMLEELSLISQMDCMLTMDSSNMHLARLVGTKVYSIWGATHPFAGFTPFGQNNPETFIQIPQEKLPCRPCSVFGNKPCHRGDYACLNWIEPKEVSERVSI
jgi:ADP-heptose:LPS heptosyltransferase